MPSDHLGQAAGRTGEPGKDLVAFPPGVSALLPGLAGGVFPGPCGFCPRIIGAGAGGRGALAGLPGLREGLVACAAGSADLCPGPGSRPGDRLLRSLPGLRDTGLSGAHRGVGVCLGAPDRLACLGPSLSDGYFGPLARRGDGLAGFLPDSLPGFLVPGDPVPEPGPG